MPKHSILILVLYFGEYKKHQKYRIINIIYEKLIGWKLKLNLSVSYDYDQIIQVHG